MEYTTLGNTGIEVSKICYGTAEFGNKRDGVTAVEREHAHELLDAAWEAGINFFDTANIYGDPPGTSERWIGEWLENKNREEVVIASKVRNPMGEGPNMEGFGRKHVRAQLRKTLERLGTDYLDIYYIHRWDDNTPVDVLLRTFDEFVRDGRVHYIGASTCAAWKLTKALWKSDVNGWERFEVTQPQYSATYREEVEEYLDVCADQGLAICSYRPLDAGFLTGKYTRDDGAPDGSRGDIRSWDPERFSDRQWRVLNAIKQVATETETTPAQVALRWVIEQGAVPIVAARSVEHLTENAGAGNLTLADNHIERIEEAYAGQE